MVFALLHNRPMARCDCALADHIEGADIQSHRRHRSCADHIAARTDWRSAELGLSILLVTRCDFHPLRADLIRLHRGGASMARLAAPCDRRPAPRIADDVQYHGPPAVDRNGTGLAARL